MFGCRGEDRKVEGSSPLAGFFEARLRCVTWTELLNSGVRSSHDGKILQAAWTCFWLVCANRAQASKCPGFDGGDSV